MKITPLQWPVILISALGKSGRGPRHEQTKRNARHARGGRRRRGKHGENGGEETKESEPFVTSDSAVVTSAFISSWASVPCFFFRAKNDCPVIASRFLFLQLDQLD